MSDLTDRIRVSDPGHVVPCELDAAYTRNVTERFDGLTHPPDNDGVPTIVEAWRDRAFGDVVFTIPDAGIRFRMTPVQAEHLGCVLIAEAARARRESA